MNKFLNIIKSCNDQKLAKELRKLYVTKIAQQAGANEAESSVLQHTSGGVGREEYNSRQHPRVQRGTGEKAPERRLYDTGKEHQDFKGVAYDAPRSMSTRYSPDHVGVQAKRVSDGVYQDPYTNKIYNWNEGFKTEDGVEYPASGVALQSELFNYAKLSHIAFIKSSQISDYKASDLGSDSPEGRAILALSPEFREYFTPLVEQYNSDKVAIGERLVKDFGLSPDVAVAYATLACSPLWGVKTPEFGSSFGSKSILLSKIATDEGVGSIWSLEKSLDKDNLIQMGITPQEEAMIKIIRMDPSVGLGSATSIDEAWDDTDLLETLRAENVSTPSDALAWAQEDESVRRSYREETRAGSRSGEKDYYAAVNSQPRQMLPIQKQYEDYEGVDYQWNEMVDVHPRGEAPFSVKVDKKTDLMYATDGTLTDDLNKAKRYRPVASKLKEEKADNDLINRISNNAEYSDKDVY